MKIKERFPDGHTDGKWLICGIIVILAFAITVAIILQNEFESNYMMIVKTDNAVYSNVQCFSILYGHARFYTEDGSFHSVNNFSKQIIKR